MMINLNTRLTSEAADRVTTALRKVLSGAGPVSFFCAVISEDGHMHFFGNSDKEQTDQLVAALQANFSKIVITSEGYE